MNNKLYFLAFALGIGVGIYGTADYFKTKYKTRADAEIEAVREAYREKKHSEEKAENKTGKPKMALDETSSLIQPKIDIPAEDIEKAREIAKKNGYDASLAPYVISPDDFGSTFEYDCVDLVYYADGVLVDENDQVVEDVEDLIGDEALEHIGEYEPDAVHVRNDEKRCDYEILVDERKWSEVKQKWSR